MLHLQRSAVAAGCQSAAHRQDLGAQNPGGVGRNREGSAAPEPDRAIVWEAGGAPHQLPSIRDIRTPTRTTQARREAAERRRQEAEQHFDNAVSLEDSNLDAAREAYMAALASHSDHLEARINLGRLLHLQGDLAGAEKIYRAAKHPEPVARVGGSATGGAHASTGLPAVSRPGRRVTAEPYGYRLIR
jgi:tetratricopeptide (TPR) repeat protein